MKNLNLIKMHGPAVFIDLTLEDQVNEQIFYLSNKRNWIETLSDRPNWRIYNLNFSFTDVCDIFGFLNEKFVVFCRPKNCEDILKVWELKFPKRNQTKASKMIYIKSLAFVMCVSVMANRTTSMAYWTALYRLWFR